jgi:hypothetical protein
VGPLFPGLVFVPFSPSHDEISATHILWGKRANRQTLFWCFFTRDIDLKA